MGEAERGEHVPRQRVSFYCSNGHETQPAFAADAQIPDTWDCPRCGCPAGLDPDDTPEPPRTEPYKTHLAYVRERRNPEDGEAILRDRFNPLVAAFYTRLVEAGKAKMAALGACMRKLLMIAYGVLKSRTPFDPSKGGKMVP